MGFVAFVGAHFVQSHIEIQPVAPPMSITKEDAYPECTDNKSKLRIELRNEGDQCIDIRAVKWIVENGDIVLQSPFWYRLQLQRTSATQSGGGGWQAEGNEIHIRPRELFRVSIGLDLPIGPASATRNDTEIRTHLKLAHTGTLELRIEVGGQVEMRTVRL